MAEFEPGNVVKVKSPDNFKGEKIAVVLLDQRWCRDGIAVMLVDKKEPIRYLCIMGHVGDTIELVAKVE